MIFIDKNQMRKPLLWIISFVFLISYFPLVLYLFQYRIDGIILIILLVFFVVIASIFYISCILHYRASNAILRRGGISNTRYYTEHIVRRWQTLEQFTRSLVFNSTKIADNQYYRCKHINHPNLDCYTKPHSKNIDLFFYTMTYEEYVKIGSKPDGYHILICDDPSPLLVMQGDPSLNGIVYVNQETITAYLEIRIADLLQMNRVSKSFQIVQKILRMNPRILLYGDNDFISYFLENVADNTVILS